MIIKNNNPEFLKLLNYSLRLKGFDSHIKHNYVKIKNIDNNYDKHEVNKIYKLTKKKYSSLIEPICEISSITTNSNGIFNVTATINSSVNIIDCGFTFTDSFNQPIQVISAINRLNKLTNQFTLSYNDTNIGYSDNILYISAYASTKYFTNYSDLKTIVINTNTLPIISEIPYLTMVLNSSSTTGFTATTTIHNVTDLSTITNYGVRYYISGNETLHPIDNTGSPSSSFIINGTGLSSGEIIYVSSYIVIDGVYIYSPNQYVQVELCLAEGTLISLYDRTQKRIEDITYDDDLLVWDFDNGKYACSKPLWIMKTRNTNKYNLLEFENNVQLRTIDQHRIFNEEKGTFTYPMTDDTPIGTTTYYINDVNNKYPDKLKLLNKSIVHENINYYNIITNYHINLFANGILTSCRYNNIYPIKDYKFIKENKFIKEDNYKKENECNKEDNHINSYINDNIPLIYIYGLRLYEHEYSTDHAKYVKRLIDMKVEKKECIDIKKTGLNYLNNSFKNIPKYL